MSGARNDLSGLDGLLTLHYDERVRRLYIAVLTNLLERRVAEHKAGVISGFSEKYKTKKLVYFEPFGDSRNAIAREKQTEALAQGEKVVLIEKVNPTWRDLSEDFNH